MTPGDFIHKKVTAELLRLGYDQTVAISSANKAVEHYRRCSDFVRGKVFDECLLLAKEWARKISSGKKSK